MSEGRQRPARRGRCVVALAGVLVCGGAGAELRPSPYDVLATRALQAPFLDPHPVCLPEATPPVWQPLLSLSAKHGFGAASRVLEARLHREYGEYSAADDPALDDLNALWLARRAESRREDLRALELLEAAAAREADAATRWCVGAEKARTLLRLGRWPEAKAAVRRLERNVDSVPGVTGAAERFAFLRAEALYYTRDEFEARQAYVGLRRAEGEATRTAAAIRLVDLRFDAGLSDRVRADYTALLPGVERAGAHPAQWALRVAEVALEEKDWADAHAWLERYLRSEEDPAARGLARVRLADAEYGLGRPRVAASELRSLDRRFGARAPGVLARVRRIDMALGDEPLSWRRARLAEAARNPAGGLSE
ncbi:MAG: hypothetical protein MJE66_15540, partial [Proteobacteria bacterium]|nr:hypothetical protein [Pseudomonadota bacterium]